MTWGQLESCWPYHASSRKAVTDAAGVLTDAEGAALAALGAGWTNYASAEDEPQVVEALLQEMVEAGWELITDDLVSFSRTFDGNADPAVRYIYAVEAIDAAGNLSTLAIGSEDQDSDL